MSCPPSLTSACCVAGSMLGAVFGAAGESASCAIAHGVISAINRTAQVIRTFKELLFECGQSSSRRRRIARPQTVHKESRMRRPKIGQSGARAKQRVPDGTTEYSPGWSKREARTESWVRPPRNVRSPGRGGAKKESRMGRPNIAQGGGRAKRGRDPGFDSQTTF